MRHAMPGPPLRAAMVALTTIVLLVPALVAQQEPPKERFGEEVEVEEVFLDVLVTDRRGDVVLGLGPEDFVVEEDGERVAVRDVIFYSNRELIAAPEIAARLGVDPDEVPTDRYFILFFDDPRAVLPRLAVQQLDAARWAKRWVDTLQPTDRVAVVAYDFDLEVHLDFTNDHEAVAKAIDKAISGPDPVPARTPVSEGASLLAQLPGPDLDANRIYDALEIVGRAAGPVTGRKNLVLFSIGFGEVNPLGIYQPDMRYYPDLVRVLNDNNIAVYGIDLIPSSAFGSLRSNILGNALSSLASDTGGRYYFNFVSFLTPLEQIAEDTSGYYLISYQSPRPHRAGEYQEVEVDTVNPELRVRSREGYIAGE